MYKLKSTNGRVNSLLRTGKDLVKDTLSISTAQDIINTGDMFESDIDGYPICVDGKWYFEGTEVEEKASRKAEKK